MKVSYQRLVNVFQGKSAIWIEGGCQGQVDGLYTDEIATCNILIFFGRKKFGQDRLGQDIFRRIILLVHHDGYRDLNDIKANEYGELDEVDSFVYCYAPSYHETSLKGRQSYYKNFSLQLEQIFLLKPQLHAAESDFDAVVARFKRESPDQLSSVQCIKSSELPNEPIVLFNHPQAAEIYAYYKTNIMLSEVEGEYIRMEKGYLGEVSWCENLGQYIYKQCSWYPEELERNLATRLQFQNLLFDGQKFLSSQNHDKELSGYASDVLQSLNINNHSSVEGLWYQIVSKLNELETDLSSFAESKELYHNYEHWGEVPAKKVQSYHIALNYAYVKLGSNFLTLALNREIELSYKSTIERYSKVDDAEKEGRLLMDELKIEKCKEFERNGFFSPSNHATKDQPFGPYSDYCCTDRDPATQLALRLTRLQYP